MNIIETAAEMRPTLEQGDLDGAGFTRKVKDIYEKVVSWRINQFLLPTGNDSKKYIDYLMLV